MSDKKTFSSTFINDKKGSLRLMFYNIYGYMWYPDKENSPHLSSGPVSLRQEMERDLIAEYAPDIVGMQEYCKTYHTGMTPLLTDIGYTEVDVAHTRTHSDGIKINYTPLFYRADRVKLLDKGFVMYPETMPDPSKDDGSVLNINDVSSKSLTWGVFEEIATGKKFIAVCTHFMYSAAWLTPQQREDVRTQNASQLVEVVKELRSRDEYKGLPVIMGGDLNTYIGAEAMKTLKNGGMEWLYEIAPVKDDSRGLKSYATYDKNIGEYVTFPEPIDDPNTAIDYIWLTRGECGYDADVKAYITVTDRKALLSSDHCPRFTDITFIEK